MESIAIVINDNGKYVMHIQTWDVCQLMYVYLYMTGTTQISVTQITDPDVF